MRDPDKALDLAQARAQLAAKLEPELSELPASRPNASRVPQSASTDATMRRALAMAGKTTVVAGIEGKTLLSTTWTRR